MQSSKLHTAASPLSHAGRAPNRTMHIKKVRQFVALCLCTLMLFSASVTQVAAQQRHTAIRTRRTIVPSTRAAKSKATRTTTKAKPTAARANAGSLNMQDKENPDGEISGVTSTGEAGVTRTNAQIMRAQRLARTVKKKVRVGKGFKRNYPDRRNLPQNPDSPLVPQTSEGDATESAPREDAPAIRETAPRTPQTPSTSFTGATLADTGAFPPDTMGDAGPSQYLVGVNGRLRSFNKTSGTADGVINADMDVFFESVVSENNLFTSDPRVRYDRVSGRWIIVIIDVPDTFDQNRVLIAVSNSGTLTASTIWTYYFFQQNAGMTVTTNNQFADYPTLGVDVNALYIGANIFDADGNFFGCRAYVVRKSSVLSGGPIVVTTFDNLLDTGFSGPYTPQGVDNFDTSATKGYFVGVDGALFGVLAIRRISDPAGEPTISPNRFITVPATRSPIDVRHLGNTVTGTAGYLDALDDRLFQAVIRNGRMWTVHNVGVNNTGVSGGTVTRNGSRWYELGTLDTTPTLIQSGTVFDPTAPNDVNQRNYWIPSIMVSGQNHVAMGFSTAGTNEYINAATVGRLRGDAPGTMGTPTLYTNSMTAYNPPDDAGGSGGRRWGDYSYTSLDPEDDMTMWTIQQFCNAENSYGVRVAKLLAPPPATPLTANPNTIAQNLASVNVTITGASNAGSGFFDPGAGFAKRIAATISGGVTVNSITYNSPTQVTLNVSTVGASAGAKNVTITNPDGQSRTGNGVIFVSAPAADTVNAAGDTWVQGAEAFRDTNYGTDALLQVKRTLNAGAGRGRRAFLKFDTSSVTGSVTRATLVVFASLSEPSLSNVPMRLQQVTDTTWNELTLTWNNQPNVTSPNALAPDIVVASTTGAFYEFNLTTFIQSERAAGRNVVAFRLINNVPTGTSGASYSIVNSKEATANRPQLIIE